jgi:2,4-didehydro-3-deoxy-L-rhamnonate hydrolase
MRLYTVKDASGDWVGAEKEGGLVDLTAAGAAPNMLELVRAGAEALRGARAAAERGRVRRPLADVEVAAPIRPSKILCSGINYRGHALENPNAKMPTEPFFFAKLPTSVIGPNEAIVHPTRTQQLDYEVEFAVVIGAPLSKAAESSIIPSIFGYTLLNDVSARDVQFKDSQITLGKNFDGFAPIGPCIVTADEMPHPDKVRLRTRLNGRTLQDDSTSDWLFPLPHLISFLSQVMTLEPGDIVSTGTPAGVGLFQKPPVFMKPGDMIEIEAEGIGVLRNPIVRG